MGWAAVWYNILSTLTGKGVLSTLSPHGVSMEESVDTIQCANAAGLLCSSFGVCYVHAIAGHASSHGISGTV